MLDQPMKTSADEVLSLISPLKLKVQSKADIQTSISEIRSLLNQTMIGHQNKNFSGATALIEKAYSENHKCIEGATR